MNPTTTTSALKAEAGASGSRLDVFLSERLPGLTRSAAQKLIADGLVTLRGRPVKKNHRVSEGEAFEVSFRELRDAGIVPQDIRLDIVYEDSDVIVVNKPKGMVVHPAAGHPDGTLVNALLYHCGDSLSGINGELRPGIVHRIDKDTSGLIIAAKNDAAHAALAAQLKSHRLSRVYETVVCGGVSEDSGTIDAPIGRSASNRKKMAVTDRNSRPAVTHYEVLARYPGYTHLRCRLETGRTHQIRVHLAHIARPILGDTVYGRKKPEPGLSGQCLHARQLSFRHPRTGQELSLSADLPEYFRKVLTKLDRLV